MSALSPEKGAPAIQPQAVPTENEIVSIKAGEYMVFVEETRALRHPTQEDETIDPIIQVEGFGKKRLSKPKEKIGTGATFWGEHFFFEHNFETTFEVEAQKVTISVLDHNSFGKNSLIGSVELSVSAVYMKDKHCIMYQWAALAGFLKFSVGVFAAGDKQVSLDQEKILDAKAASGQPIQVLYPPQIKTVPYQLKIRAFRAEQLKKMDTFGQTDPYVKVEYGGQVIQSTVKKVTLEPIWSEELLVPLSMPTINNRLVIKLVDWEQVQTHEILGSNIFNIEDIKAGKYKLPFWSNIYGTHTGAKSEWLQIMNNIPETATEWKGRVQLSITLEESEKPELKTLPIKEAKVVDIANQIKRENYELKADIHYALNLPKNGVKYQVKIRWGKSEVITKKKESKDRMIEIYESLVINETFPIGSLGEEEIPDIFVYLNDGDKDFSYIRKKMSSFSDPSSKARPISFQNDKSMTAKRDDLAGVVKMRILARKAGDKNQAFVQYGWDRNVEKRPAQLPWKLHVNVYQAKNLISGDISGLSDPYLNVYFNGVEQKTSVINDTTNPIWNERLEFGAQFNNVDEAPPLMLTLWDQDTGALGDDFLGSAMYVITEKDVNLEDLPKPVWVNFSYGKNGQYAGKVLLSVCCYNQPELIPRSPYIEPDMQKYILNMKILGLRSLESAGLLPVKKAFVRFDIDSLKRKQDKSALPEKKALRTEPLNPGPNPNILTVINIDAMLPVDPDFCPSLTCSVYDYMFKGVSQPLIGNFAINLGEYIKETENELNKRIEVLTAYARAKQEAKQREAEAAKQAEQNAPKNEDDERAQEEEEIGLLIEKENNEVTENKTLDELLKSDSPLCRITASRRFLMFAQYDKEGIEIRPPEAEKYIELGHTKKDGTSQKQYRFLVPQDLEKSGLIDVSPFAKIPIYRGKTASDEGFFAKLLGGSEENKVVGYFKSMIHAMSENDKMRFDSKINSVAKFINTKKFEFSDDEFLRKTEVVIRLYVIEAEDLPDRDDDSNSDPYLVISFGNNVFNESKNYQLDNPNPKFYKCYEYQFFKLTFNQKNRFSGVLPGASDLKIQLWDHDDLDADDLIGETSIDVEDRWYSAKWRSLKYIPVETRELYHPSSKVPKGKVKLWVEIHSKEEKRPPVWEISPKPPAEFELRVVVWECKNVPKVDIEDAVDIYITGTLEDGQEQRTDTHFRSLNGKGSFNWRMVYNLTLPARKNRISLKIWDKDLLTKNDFISEASFDFDSFAERAFEKEEIVNITSEKENKFWIPCTRTEVVDGKNVTKNLGDVLISMMIVPKKQALLSPVGPGRSNPNQNPYLPPPVGRLQLTWNPIKMFEQLVGPVARRTFCIGLCVVCTIFIIIMMLPSFFATELAENIL